MSDTLPRFDGKAALVTGASGGIGEAIAVALHAQGASVVLSGTRGEALAALKAELGARAHVAVCNLADTASVVALPKTAEAAAGPIDIGKRFRPNAASGIVWVPAGRRSQ